MAKIKQFFRPSCIKEKVAIFGYRVWFLGSTTLMVSFIFHSDYTHDK